MESQRLLEKVVGRALSGKGAHVEACNTFDGLDWSQAGIVPEGSPHSIFQLLAHVTYWQDWSVRWLEGEDPPLPEQASRSWPEETAPSREEWDAMLGRFQDGLNELDRIRRRGDLLAKPVSSTSKKNRLEMLHTIASHNSHHLGQVVLLRRILGAWPPPGGGLDW